MRQPLEDDRSNLPIPMELTGSQKRQWDLLKSSSRVVPPCLSAEVGDLGEEPPYGVSGSGDKPAVGEIQDKERVEGRGWAWGGEYCLRSACPHAIEKGFGKQGLCLWDRGGMRTTHPIQMVTRTSQVADERDGVKCGGYGSGGSWVSCDAGAVPLW